MTQKRRTRYQADLKMNAIDLVRNKGFTVAEAAETLHLGYGTVYSWIKWYDLNGQMTDSTMQGIRLKHSLKDLREGLWRLLPDKK